MDTYDPEGDKEQRNHLLPTGIPTFVLPLSQTGSDSNLSSSSYVPPRKKPDFFPPGAQSPMTKTLQRPMGLAVPSTAFGRRSLNENQFRESLAGNTEADGKLTPSRLRPTCLSFVGSSAGSQTASSGIGSFLDVDDPVPPRPSSAVDTNCVRFLRGEDAEIRQRESSVFGDFNATENNFERLASSLQAGESGSVFESFRDPDGGFLDFQSRFPELCEGSAHCLLSQSATNNSTSNNHPCAQMATSTQQQQQHTSGRSFSRLSPRLSSLSQPCLPATSQGPTRILPFMYLGSQHDAGDPLILKKYGIRYVINLSISCPKPEYVPDTNFLRIPVNDSYQEKLLPYFEKAFALLDKARESNSCVLVHCLAGISRSATLAIAYIMTHLHMNCDEAYAYVKAKRPSISPNLNFMGQLLEFEKLQKKRHGREAREQLKQSMRRVLVRQPKCARIDVQQQQSGTPGSTPTSTTSESHTFTDAQRRRLGIPLQVHSGHRGGEVAVLRRQHTITDAAPAQAAAAEDAGSNWSLSDSPGAMRRSLSCPIKIHKVHLVDTGVGDAELENTDTAHAPGSSVAMVTMGSKVLCCPVPDDLSNVSPSHEPNANGKREMRPKSVDKCADGTDSPTKGSPEDSPTATTAAVSTECPPPDMIPVQQQSYTMTSSRSLAFGTRRGLNIPFIVKEDLPSPSTEMATKLSFADVMQRQSPPPRDMSASYHSAVNPFFAAITKQRQLDSQANFTPVVLEQPQSACSSSTPMDTSDTGASHTPGTADSVEGGSMHNPMFHAGTPTASSALGNCAFFGGSRTATSGQMRTGIAQVVAPCVWSNSSSSCGAQSTSKATPNSTPQQPIITVECTSASNQGTIGLSRRIAQFIKRSTGQSTTSAVTNSKPTSPSTSRHNSQRPSNFFAPKSVTVGEQLSKQGVYGGVMSLMPQGGTQLPPAPCKSQSESALLSSFSSELDSPESGFVESPIDITPFKGRTRTGSNVSSNTPCEDRHGYGLERDRESMGSTSSLEIAVHS